MRSRLNDINLTFLDLIFHDHIILIRGIHIIGV